MQLGKNDPIKEYVAARTEAREQAEQDARDRQNEKLQERARVAYVTAGGDEKSFEKAWPSLREEILRDETIRQVRGDK